MKKILVLILALCLIFAACSSKKKGTQDLPNSSSSTVLSRVSSTSTSQMSQSESTPITSKPVPIKETSVMANFDNSKKGWGQGVQVNAEKIPLSCLSFQKKYEKYDAHFIGQNEKKIYLTFDLGYENGYTNAILDTLLEKKVKAVFFLTFDYFKNEPDIVNRMIAEGHTIGNHTVSHYSMPDISIEKCNDEIMNLHNYVKEKFGISMTLLRPPKGEFSERTLAIAQSLGYKTVFWSFAYVDWINDNQMGEEKAFEKVSNAAHNGAIYLLHPTSKDNSVILPKVIDDFIQKGYSVEVFK
jgi:peptidoglycan-N-acetylmuramic acid deacetylase